MKKISERFRKSLRMIFRGIGVSVVSLIVQACYGIIPPDRGAMAYGMPYPNGDITISGKVKANGTEIPISGIKVSVEDSFNYILTDNDGNFDFTLPNQNVYNLKIEDIDGPLNGGLFKQKTMTVYRNEINIPLLICLDADTDTDEE